MLQNRFLKVATGLVLALGVTATTLWLLEISPDDWRRLWFEVLLALLCTVGLTVGNLGIRWLRWHYVSRRLGFYVRVRDSYRLFVITLPAIATPFYLGELVRGLFLRSRYPGTAPVIFTAWILERTADVAALLVILFVLGRQYIVASGVVAVWYACVMVLTLPSRGPAARIPSRVRFASVVVTLSATAWSLPVLGLWVTLHLIGTGLPLYPTAEAFVTGTLLGGVSGIPLGTGVTGSLTAVRLIAGGVASDLAPLAVAVMRSGTAWFSLVLGLIAAYHWRGRVAGLSEPQTVAGHFDEIAEGYADQITGHVRVRLLSRKISTMRDRLEAAGFDSSARGLDVGCGQGWYADEMTRLGYRIHGMDAALRQVEASPETTSASFLQGEAPDLPFPEDAFDFAYGINVIHHILDPQARRESLSEIVRVLRPGGLFFLHEINTRNPLFAFYISYLFPVMTTIDEGNEIWVRPDALPQVQGAAWTEDVDYFTFLPDFVPAGLVKTLGGMESFLEHSRMQVWSAHYMACLVKEEV